MNSKLRAAITHNPVNTHIVRFGGAISLAYVGLSYYPLPLMILMFLVAGAALQAVIGKARKQHYETDCDRCDERHNPPNATKETRRLAPLFRLMHRTDTAWAKRPAGQRVILSIAGYAALLGALFGTGELIEYLIGEQWAGLIIITTVITVSAGAVHCGDRHRILAPWCTGCQTENDEETAMAATNGHRND